MKAYWVAVGLVVAAMGVATSPAGAVEGSFFNDADYTALGRVDAKSGGVIAAGNREAAQAGLEILDAGGNAVDAAAATLFAVGVAQFESCGIGGGGFMVYRSADGQVVDTIDFREWSPKNYTFSDWARVGPTYDVAAWGTGHNVVGIPGAVAGMALALQKYGSIPKSLGNPEGWRDNWKKVLQPAIKLATTGFTVSKASQAAVLHPRTPFFPITDAIYGDAPDLYAKREKMRNQWLADDMRELRDIGPEAFYDPFLLGGTIAAHLLAEMNRPSPYFDQAIWEPSDLTAYRAISRPAVRTRYRSSEYIGMGAPSSAGPAIAQVLNILQGYDVAAMGQSSADHVHLFAEAMKLAWRDRAKFLGDPDLPFEPKPAFAPSRFQTYQELLNFLASKEYAKVLRDQINPNKAQAFGGESPAAAGTNTHNIAVIDKAGNAVALNCSIEQPLGSSVTAAGTGFPLNNQLTDFEPPKERFKPETAPKGPGLWPTEEDGQEGQEGPANGWAPRKRPRSSMAPSIVVRKGAPHAGSRVSSSRARMRQHSQHAPLVVFDLLQPQLREDVADVALHGLGAERQDLLDAAVAAPLGHQRQQLALPRRELRQAPLRRLRVAQRGDDLAIDGNAARGDPPDRVGQHPDVGDALLEDVADSRRAMLEQANDVLRLDVVRQHEHPDLGHRDAEPRGDTQAFVTEVGGHPHVDDQHVRLVQRDGVDGVRCRSHVRHDLEAGLREEPHDPLAQQRLILGDDEAERPLLEVRHRMRLARVTATLRVLLEMACGARAHGDGGSDDRDSGGVRHEKDVSLLVVADGLRSALVVVAATC